MDLQSKIWNQDMTTLTTAEINSLVQLMFYQVFMVEVDSCEVKFKTDEYGARATFIISGEALMDESNIDASDERFTEEEEQE